MKTLSTAVGASLLAVALVSAQAKPDLSGTWVPDPSKSSGGGAAMRVGGGGMSASSTGAGAAGAGGGDGAAISSGTVGVARASGGGGGFGGAVETRISQSSAGLTIERIMGPVTQSYIHSFNGTENLNVNGQVTMRTKSRWDGNSLVTEGTTHVNTENGELTTTVKEVRSLDADGALVVETERITDSSRRVSRQVYKRK